MQYLSDKSLKSVLPNYTQIFSLIKDIRKENIENGIDREAFQHFPYNNVISIMGERGSGKTTVFATLRVLLLGNSENIKVEDYDGSIKDALSKNDNFLNLIVPEMLEEGTDLLGVILLNLKSIINEKKDEIDEYYEKNKIRYSNGFDSCRYSELNKIEEIWRSVFNTYLMRAEGFSKIAQSTYSSFMDYSRERQKGLESEIRLTEEIYRLFTEFSNIFSNSLTYIFIDDIDINQNRCAEVINTILRYLKHPSLVIFISCDKEKLERELLYYELKKDSSYNLSAEKLEDSKREYVYELLKKIVPYSSRFNLQKLNSKERMNMKYPSKNNNDNFKEAICKAFFKDHEEDIINDILLDSVFEIFDSKPRGIITIWDHINRYFGKVEKNSGTIEAKYYSQLLENIIYTNESLKNYEEIIKKCIYIYNDNEDKVKLDVKYELFLNYISSEIMNVNNDKSKESLNKKNKMQNTFANIVNLFYFFELIINKVVDKNSEGKIEHKLRGSFYSDMLNMIIDINDDNRIYYRANTALEILKLYNKLTERLELSLQSEIYKNKTYFKTYENIINEFYKDEASSIKQRTDYDWDANYYKVKATVGNSSIKVINELIRIFDGVEYDQELLEDKRNINELDSRVDNNFQEEAKGSNLKLAEFYTRAIKFKRKWYSCFEFNNDILDSKRLTDLTYAREKLKECIERPTRIIKDMFDDDFVKEVLRYNDGRENNSITQYLEEYDSNKVSNPLIVVNIVKHIKKYVSNKMLYYTEFNSSTCANIAKMIDNNSLKLNFKGDFYDYKQVIIDRIYELQRYKLSLNKNSNYSHLLQLVRNIEYTDSKNADSKPNEEYKVKNEQIFSDNLKEGSTLIEHYENDNFGWQMRRKNLLSRLFELMSLVFIEIRCDELMYEFDFINQKEIIKLLELTDDEIRNYLEVSYKHIHKLYYDNKIYYVKNNIKAFETIGEIKNKLLEYQEYYTIKDFNITELNKFISSIKSNEYTFYNELTSVQHELISKQKIKKTYWDSINSKIDLYIRTLKYNGEDQYYASSIEVINKAIFRPVEEVGHAPLLADIEREEEKRILQAEYEAMILIMKDIIKNEN